MRDRPLVSVITATYNRSQVLRHAIESVRRSTNDDWEHLVIGDHCTDDTADVVRAIADPRVSFTNLPVNAGEQSAPNNEGLRQARGRYVAYLNHDDLYFPDHLGSAIARLQQTGADFVWSPLVVLLPATADDLAADRWSFRLSGVPPGDTYDPRLFVFASAWVMTRALAERVGPWRPARETFVTSSQDWLWRAWRSGATMHVLPRVTVMAIPASMRRGYADTGCPEHDVVAARLRSDPSFRETALERAALNGERDANAVRFGQAPLGPLRGWMFRPVAAAAMALGLHPHAPYFALRHGRRGNLVSAVRRRSGLDGLR
jgi:hypothetical protein